MCEHCGTVTRALTVWSVEDTAFCACDCHNARRYDQMNTKQRKKARGKDDRKT